MQDTLVIALVTDDPAIALACRTAVATLTGHASTAPASGPLTLARSRAALFVAGLEEPVVMQIVHGATVAEAQERLAALGEDSSVGLCVVDTRACLRAHHLPGAAQSAFDALHRGVASGKARGVRTSYSEAALIPVADYDAHPFQSTRRYRVRVIPDDAELLEAEMTALFTNYLEHVHTNRLAQRRLRAPEGRVTLGVHLLDLMKQRFEEWVLSYYTGSIVSSLIDTLDAGAPDAHAMVLRGPSEHSLACASFIHWRLYRRGFLMVLTSSMVDELKGTLANLQQSGAKGVIVVADAAESKWFGFQATVGSDADVRRVLEARRIPFVYAHDPSAMPRALEEIATKLDAADGPVVLVATQAVLESRAPLGEPPALAPAPRGPATGGVPAELARVIDIVNREKTHLVWQCGALTPEEADLAFAISERAGIALCESLSAPGFLPGWRNGRRVPSHLGVLGQYGSTQEVLTFLSTDGKLNPQPEQWLFVIKGKLGQIDSPYSDGEHSRRLRICQVNARAAHIGPFADIGLVMPARAFLEEIAAALDVDAGVLAHRRAKLEAWAHPADDVLGALPTLPMTPNYFFSSLRRVMEELIVERGYRHTGIYDVGHCGTLGVRYLPRTDPSYSGWYGRGLMGDALQSAAALVVPGKSDVVAIVGDGARQITADVMPGIVEALSVRGRPIEKNVTIFVLANNLFSVINAYQERIMYHEGGRQMDVTNADALHEHDADVVVAGTRIVRRRVLRFDHAMLADALSARGRVNVFTVPLVTNSDGISIIDQDNWQYGARTTKTARAGRN